MGKIKIWSDSFDSRDFTYTKTNKKLPQQLDLRKFFGNVSNQGSISSCVAHAICGALSITDKTTVFSTLYNYYYARFLVGREHQDNGSSLREGLRALAKFGICKEQEFENDVDNVFIKPLVSNLVNPKFSYFRLENSTDVKDSLFNGNSVVVGIQQYNETSGSKMFYRTGNLELPQPHHTLFNGHAVCVVGYSDMKQAFLVRQSEGVMWGASHLKGHFWLPYEYVNNKVLTFDIWSVKFK